MNDAVKVGAMFYRQLPAWIDGGRKVIVTVTEILSGLATFNGHDVLGVWTDSQGKKHRGKFYLKDLESVETVTLEKYLNDLTAALPPHFAPGQIYHGRAGALRLGHEVGYGLAGFPPDQVNAELQTLYSRLLIRNTFGTQGGVPIDHQTWLAAVRQGREAARC